MSKVRTSRTRLAAAAATAVLAALSLTACNDTTGAADEGAAATVSPSVSSGTPSASAGSASGSSSGSGATDEGAAPAADPTPASSASASKPSASSGKPVTCEGSNTRTAATPLSSPVNHMLLTVTNTGSKTCFLYGYPTVQFTGAQSQPPVIEDSQPQAVVTLEPGQSGYAAISLSAADGSGSNGYTAKSLTVYFSGRSMSGNVGAAAHPSLPAKGAYIDDSIKVTYWQQAMSDATNW